MKFKDVAHLYLGCKAQAVYKTKDEGTGKDVVVELPTIRTLESVGIDGDRVIMMWVGGNLSASEHKPILRPLSNLNTTENMEIYAIEHIWNLREHKSMVITYAQITKYLLLKHFDLFDLIESGEAIDATKLNPNPYQL